MDIECKRSLSRENNYAGIDVNGFVFLQDYYDRYKQIGIKSSNIVLQLVSFHLSDGRVIYRS